MSSGLLIKVKSSFSRVIKDLSFIDYVRAENIAFDGVFGGSAASSILNHSDKLPGVVSSVSVNGGALISYSQDSVNFRNYVSSVGAIGVNLALNAQLAPVDGVPQAFCMTFRNVNTVQDGTARLHPIGEFYMQPSGMDGTPALTICIYLNSAGQKRIGAWSGGLYLATPDSVAAQCSVDVDWSKAGLITAAVSRSADGTVLLAVQQGTGSIVTTQFKFPVATIPASVTGTRVNFGSFGSRMVNNADILQAQYWHDTALSLAELKDQVSIAHLKARSRAG